MPPWPPRETRQIVYRDLTTLGKCTRIIVGGLAPEWHAYEEGYGALAEFKPDGETPASDPMQLYFTIRYDVEAQARAAHARHVPGRTSLDHVLDRAAARRHQ